MESSDSKPLSNEVENSQTLSCVREIKLVSIDHIDHDHHCHRIDHDQEAAIDSSMSALSLNDSKVCEENIANHVITTVPEISQPANSSFKGAESKPKRGRDGGEQGQEKGRKPVDGTESKRKRGGAEEQVQKEAVSPNKSPRSDKPEKKQPISSNLKKTDETCTPSYKFEPQKKEPLKYGDERDAMNKYGDEPCTPSYKFLLEEKEPLRLYRDERDALNNDIRCKKAEGPEFRPRKSATEEFMLELEENRYEIDMYHGRVQSAIATLLELQDDDEGMRQNDKDKAIAKFEEYRRDRDLKFIEMLYRTHGFDIVEKVRVDPWEGLHVVIGRLIMKNDDCVKFLKDNLKFKDYVLREK